MNPQQPLSQLRDIHLPEPVSWWPPAPGWWLLGVLLAVAVAGLLYGSRRYLLATAWRRQGRRLLVRQYRLWQLDHDDQRYLQGVNEVLKRTALRCFPEAEVAALSGQRWTRFLDRHLKPGAGSFSDGPLALGPYCAEPMEADLAKVQQLALRWPAPKRRLRHA